MAAPYTTGWRRGVQVPPRVAPYNIEQMKGSMIGKETPRKPPLVLVVDDESSIVAAFTETLQLDGYDTVPAHSAEDGLRLLDDGLMPDAVLLDLRMPGMGGLGFLLSLRAHPERQRIPVAVVTADTHLDDTAQEAVQALGADLCFKPMTMQDVLTLAAKLIAPIPRFQNRRLIH